MLLGPLYLSSVSGPASVLPTAVVPLGRSSLLFSSRMLRDKRISPESRRNRKVYTRESQKLVVTSRVYNLTKVLDSPSWNKIEDTKIPKTKQSFTKEGKRKIKYYPFRHVIRDKSDNIRFFFNFYRIFKISHD